MKILKTSAVVAFAAIALTACSAWNGSQPPQQQTNVPGDRVIETFMGVDTAEFAGLGSDRSFGLHLFKPSLLGLNSENEDDKDLHNQKRDHKSQNAANVVRPE